MKKPLIFAIATLCFSALIFTACKKDKEEEPTVTTPTENPNAQFAVGQLSGVSFNMTEGENNVESRVGSSDSKAVPPDTSKINYYSYFKNKVTLESLTVTRGTRFYFADQPWSDAQFFAYFPLKTIPYAKEPLNYSKQDGVEIEYRDKDGKLWATTNGSADQALSTFEITETREVVVFGIQTVLVRAKVRCTLYSEDGTEQRTLDVTFKNGYQNLE